MAECYGHLVGGVGGEPLAVAFKVRRQVFPHSFGEFLPDNAMLLTKGQYRVKFIESCRQ